MPLSLKWEECDLKTAPAIAQHLYKSWLYHSINGIEFNEYLKNFNEQYDVDITYDIKTNRLTFNISPEKMLLLDLLI